MKQIKSILFSTCSALCLMACSGDDNIAPEKGVFPEDRTYVVFNPVTSELPIPNDLLFASEPLVDGTMNAGSDPGNPVVSGIDALEGNSILAPIDIAFTGSLNAEQTLDARSFVSEGSLIIPNPNQNIFLLPLSYPSGDAIASASADLDGDGQSSSVEVPTFSEALAYQGALTTQDFASITHLAAPSVRAELISLDGGVNNVVRITPLAPLIPKTKYLVVIADVEDVAGNPVFPSRSYETIRDPESNIGAVNPALLPLRPSIQAWESLALGYFSFKSSVYEAMSLSHQTPTYDDLIMTMTFTTTATSDVLSSMAAPEMFFKQSLMSTYKKGSIVKTVTGVYTLNGDTTALSDTTDIAINQTLSFLLTSNVLPDASSNPLYQADIAQAIGAGADYATITESNPTAAYVIQTAAAQAAIQVHDSGDAAQGDMSPYVDIETEAVGTVMALSGNNPASIFPIPQSRTSRFFRVDDAGDINPLLAAPAKIYQGEITLPQYLNTPSGMDGSVLVSDSWTADTTIGQVIDVARGNDPGTTPPSDKTTYRYPFPEEKSQATMPLLAVVPDEATLSSFGITKPAEGWPVIIHVHGIAVDRSASLPAANALAFACVRPDLSGVTGSPCFATITIDQPVHGLSASGSTIPGLYDATNPGAALVANLPASAPMGPSAELSERHFGFTADATAQPIPMDYDLGVGASGSLFVNLTNFENARDKLRQMVVDLLNVNASIGTMDVDGDGSPDFDTDRVYMIGVSLGGVDGIPFVAVNNYEDIQASMFSSLPKVRAAAMINTGGGLPKLLVNSNSRAPAILQGLAAASSELQQGRSGLESYFNVFQGVLDSVDPMGFAPMLSDVPSDTGILLTEVIGDGTGNPPSDLTIPNAADAYWGSQFGPLVQTLDNGFVISGFGAPLAGTEPLIAEFSAVKTADVVDDGDAAVMVTRFIEGSHGNIVSAGNEAAEPYSSAAVFAEMLSEITVLFATNGNVSTSIISNTDVVEP